MNQESLSSDSPIEKEYFKELLEVDAKDRENMHQYPILRINF
eukprot:CAMPEP_0196820096 /NCGR_PEP_ID=MMETSP1362-20130617/73617_1 /TAXON_ID=163516 /ORGANISM="Leptocylindrus danicus, Strain CCMP1856" /LENGTH=41 /DNA_ID= /DNA_START= /DNA_END= /DNA_ORIENTATION=